MKTCRLEVWRVMFGGKDDSHSSELIAVTNSDHLPFAIEERQKRMTGRGSVIDWQEVTIQGCVMTPLLFLKE